VKKLTGFKWPMVWEGIPFSEMNDSEKLQVS
jgi:hypothetical protein